MPARGLTDRFLRDPFVPLSPPLGMTDARLVQMDFEIPQFHLLLAHVHFVTFDSPVLTWSLLLLPNSVPVVVLFILSSLEVPEVPSSPSPAPPFFPIPRRRRYPFASSREPNEKRASRIAIPRPPSPSTISSTISPSELNCSHSLSIAATLCPPDFSIRLLQSTTPHGSLIRCHPVIVDLPHQARQQKTATPCQADRSNAPFSNIGKPALTHTIRHSLATPPFSKQPRRFDKIALGGNRDP
ncbi:hypothetical protein QBC45DRAFT_205269 [Copromyces sp. CBS 386.78]|nr:hypothetical protein QBC45DRAFT_205269 [Copromyces sp. CBS 386.78]